MASRGEGLGPTFLKRDEAFHWFNQRYAIVLQPSPSGCRIVEYDEQTGTYCFYQPKDIKNFTAHKMINMDGNFKHAFDFWFHSDSANRYRGVVFDPSASAVQIPSRDGEKPFNLWRGWAYEPRPGRCELFLAHIRDVICGGDKQLSLYVETWLANLFQDPNARPGTAIVLRGGQGTGKGVFANTIGKLLTRAHYLHIASSDLLIGRFNAHFAGKLLVFADEAFWAGDKSAEGRLKALITEDDLVVEPKGRAPFTIRNLVRLIIASNERWVVPAGLDERRYVVLDVSPEHRNDHTYFEDIFQELRNGGYEALLYHFLHEVDSTQLNLRQIPQTQALLDQKVENADSVFRFWWHAVEDRELFEEAQEGGPLVKSLVYSRYAGNGTKTRWKDPKELFWRKTRRLFGDLLRENRTRRGGARIRVVQLPTIDQARQCLMRALNGEVRL